MGTDNVCTYGTKVMFGRLGLGPYADDCIGIGIQIYPTRVANCHSTPPTISHLSNLISCLLANFLGAFVLLPGHVHRQRNEMTAILTEMCRPIDLVRRHSWICTREHGPPFTNRSILDDCLLAHVAFPYLGHSDNLHVTSMRGLPYSSLTRPQAL